MGSPTQMTTFLEKHFNKDLDNKSREAILEDYPKPNCSALVAPRIDEEAATQMRRNFKNAHFGTEKTLYKIQEQMLKVAGPLACLWADMVNPNTEVNKEGIALVVQRALVLLGGTSHAISTERRKIAWARINPKLKSLATEEYKDREDRLFGPGFLEKATKKLETEKPLAKVTELPNDQQKRPYQEDKTDLRSFLSNFYPRAPPASTATGEPSARTSRTIHPAPTNGANTSKANNTNKANTNRASTGSTLQPRSQDNHRRGREDSELFAKMDRDHLGSLGTGSGEGLPAGAGTYTLPSQPSDINSKDSRGTPVTGSRDPGAVSEGSNSKGLPMHRTVHQQTVRNPKERWIPASSYQPQTPQSIYRKASFQDGGIV